MDKQFQYADLARMEQLPRCAIVCRTAEEAEEFYHNVSHQFPEFVRWSLDELMNLWDYHKSETGFTFFCDHDTEPGSITYCDVPWFRSSGYVLVEYLELVNAPELEESGYPIDFLIGGAICT